MQSIIDLEIIDSSFSSCMYNAGRKPRLDASQFLIDQGAEKLELSVLPTTGPHSHWNAIRRRINILLNEKEYMHKCASIKNRTVFLQYPIMQYSPYGKTRLLKLLKANGNKIILLIHDIDSFRLNNAKVLAAEKKDLTSVDVCIVHSEAMTQHMHKIGIKPQRTVNLEFFDYRNTHNLPPKKILQNIQLVFAGNLNKSIFLRNLSEIKMGSNMQIFLYGAPSRNITTNENIIYKGKFAPDNINEIEGNWGLVWDGESIDTCTGFYGEYLKINAPFKMSMYLAAKIPVVVWSQSAMAEYVKKYKVGVCVDSLNDIYSTIQSLSDEQLAEITQNLEMVSAQVRTGSKLIDAIKKC